MRLRGDSLPRILSLSGGYDSTCIMASALRVLGPKELRAFSYVSEQGRAVNADATIAADVSRHWGIDHRTIQIPRPRLPELVEGNARQAFAAANPCGELGVWTNLDQRLDFVSGQARLFFGDNIFGHDQNWRLSSREDALAWLPMPGLEEFGQLHPFLNDATCETTKNAYAGVLGEVLERGAKIENPINLKDFFYFEQRAQHALMPWRERFCGQHGQAVNPLMDGAVLEFYRHVPREYRRRRKLYRMTVEAMYPAFFKRKRATTLGSALSFRSMLNADAAWVEERIRTLHPALAEVVSGPSLLALLPSLSGPAKTPEKHGWKTARASLAQKYGTRRSDPQLLPPPTPDRARDHPGAPAHRRCHAAFAFALTDNYSPGTFVPKWIFAAIVVIFQRNASPQTTLLPALDV